MASVVYNSAVILAFLICCTPSLLYARPLYFIHAPNVLRLGIEETIAVFIQNSKSEIPFNVELESISSKKETFYKTQGKASNGAPALINIKVDFYQLPPSSNAEKQFVTVLVSANHAELKFQEKRRLLVSRLSQETFIQTDKPIYTPGQTVRIRIVPVDIQLMPRQLMGTMEIKNANGDIVERWDRLVSRKAYMTKTFELGDNPVIGNWTVSYMQETKNTSVQFEVREYTLPRFSVKITGPPYVLKSDKVIPISVTSKHVYGRPVSGAVALSMSVINDRGETIPIQTFRDLLDKGKTAWSIPIDYVKGLPNDMWFPDGDRLLLEATVVERATGHSESATDTSIHFSSTPFTITFKRSMSYFKPGLPFEVKVNVLYPNKKPAPLVELSIQGSVKDAKGKVDILLPYSGTTLKALTDENGDADVTFGVPRDAVELKIEAKAHSRVGLEKDVNKVFAYTVTQYSSPSQSYVLVRSPRSAPQVDSSATMEVFLLSSKPVGELHYMITSKGRILLAKTVPNPGAILTLRFKVSSAMVPSSNMVVYYTIENNGKSEVVSDFVPFTVESKFANEVSIEAIKNTKPGEKLTITIKGSPNSEAAILAVDKSVYLLRDMHRMSRSKVFKRLSPHDLKCSFGGGKDADSVFADAGLLSMSNAGIASNTRDDMKCNAKKSRKRRSDNGDACCRKGELARRSPKSCQNQADTLQLTEDCRLVFMSCCKYAGRSIVDPEEEEEDIEEEGRQVQVRSNFPETWLFGDVSLDGSGIGKLVVTVPDTITTWVVQSFAVSQTTGLGVAKPFDLVAFKPFFIQVNLPYSVNRGEQVMLSATLYNYKDQKENAIVYMKGDPGVCYEKKEGERSSRQRIVIAANDAFTVYFPVIPLDLGPNNVTVIAFTRDAGDAVRRPLNIEPEGIEKIETISEMIDPSAEIGKETHYLNIPIEMPPDVIPESESSTVYITGDLLAPLVTKLLSNVKKALVNPVDVYQVSSTETYTLTVPLKYTYTRSENYQVLFRSFSPSCTCNSRNGGCMRSRSATRAVQATATRQVQRTQTRTVWRQADRFVVRSIAPNVYVLRYLAKTNQLTAEIENQGKAFITESYRRLLGHRTPDGSFSLWGNKAGTLWMTAFVVQNLQDASELVAIDNAMKCKAVDFLLKSQLKDGSFLEKGTTYSKAMMGGNNGDPAMTAFVVISLMEATCSEHTMRISTARESARKYLEARLGSAKRPYDVAILSYALVLLNSPYVSQALQKLERLAVDNKEKKTRHWVGESESVSIEATAYALLALLQMRKQTYAKAVVKYLVSHRNAEGGFSAGQDTVVGLKALAEYSDVQPALDLEIKMTSSRDPLFQESLRLTSKNALVQKAFQVPSYGNLTIASSGVGTAEIQVEIHYNTPRPFAEKCHFSITTDVAEKSTTAGTGAYGVELRVCVRHTGPTDVGLSSVEVGILSGFVPVASSFESLKNQSIIRRFEYSDRTIILYLEKIPRAGPLCMPMSFQRSFDVGLVQPARVTVKDLLAPEIKCSAFYSPSGSSPMLKKICRGTQCQCMAERCAPCRPTRVRSNFCKHQLVIRAKILNSPDETANWKKYKLSVQYVYRGSDVISAKTHADIWVSGTCSCPRFSRGSVYVIMGEMADGKLRMTETSLVRSFPDRKRSADLFQKMDARFKKLEAESC